MFVFLTFKRSWGKGFLWPEAKHFLGPAAMVPSDSVMDSSGARSGGGVETGRVEGTRALLVGVCALVGDPHQASQSVMQALR